MSIFNKHVHQWEDVSWTFTPPAGNLQRVNGTSEYMVRMVMYGMTNIVQRCAVCSKVDVTTVAGKAERRGDIQ